MCYNYGQLLKDLKSLHDSGVKIGSLGHSVFGRNIWYAICGQNSPKTLVFGGIHAREHITSKLVSDLARGHKGEAVVFVPMANPDGVELCVNGVKTAPESAREFLKNLCQNDFSLWKANGRGVDLNVNFNAGWGKGKQNVFAPSPQNYVGKFCESEPETKALLTAVKRFDIKKALCYHAKGEVVYYGYENGETDRGAAVEAAKILGYNCLKSEGSHGGFKDWLTKYGNKALTIEVGSDSKTYLELYDEYPKILQSNRRLLAAFTERIWTKNL